MEPSTKKRPSKKKSGVDTGDLLLTSEQPKENISIVIEEKEPEPILKEKPVEDDAA